MIAFYTLFKKEILRFWKVGFQTLTAPILTALMYQMIFSQVMSKHADVFPGVSYVVFLIPGLMMMSMTQNAFANGSSSLIQAKIMGNIIFLLLPAITPMAFLNAYVGAAIVRGLVVGIGVFLATCWVGLPIPAEPLWLLIFAFLGCGVLGCLGVIAGIWADKFDQLAAFQNFLIMPLTFLSGVFYSIHTLPPFWQFISHYNPIFYMIDGFRYGFFAHSDLSPLHSLTVVSIAFVLVYGLAWKMIASGYKLRS
jgi:ABC-2 type transport system permease protein